MAAAGRSWCRRCCPVRGRSAATESGRTQLPKGRRCAPISLELGSIGRHAHAGPVDADAAEQRIGAAPLRRRTSPTPPAGIRARRSSGNARDRRHASARERCPQMSKRPQRPRQTIPCRSCRPVPAQRQWWMQLGSFSHARQCASGWRATLTQGGLQRSRLRGPMRSKGKDLYRVRAGPVGDRAAAVGPAVAAVGCRSQGIAGRALRECRPSVESRLVRADDALRIPMVALDYIIIAIVLVSAVAGLIQGFPAGSLLAGHLGARRLAGLETRPLLVPWTWAVRCGRRLMVSGPVAASSSSAVLVVGGIIGAMVNHFVAAVDVQRHWTGCWVSCWACCVASSLSASWLCWHRP